MKALQASTPPILQLSSRHQTTRYQKPFFSLSSPSKPIVSLPLSLHHSNLRSKFSSSVSTTPFAPEVESQENEESFDWHSQWYPVAVECDLDKKVPHARRIMGLDVVVWWDRNEESWQVFDDSCPHRLAPLSEGRIDQSGRLQCVYHGWCFNGSGDCKFIPQAPPDGPQVHTSRKACTAVYPSVVQNKIIWFWPKVETQNISSTAREKPPYLPELDDPSYTSLWTTRDLPYGYEYLIENFMDPAHVPYAHFGILTPGRKPRVKVDREGGMPLEINVIKQDKNGFLAEQGNLFNKFVAPCLYYLSPKPVSEDGSSTLVNKKSQNRVLGVFLCIPVGPGKSRVMFTFSRNFTVWTEQLLPLWIMHIRYNLVLDSDLYFLHQEEHKLRDVGVSNWENACFVPTASDASVIAYRNWLKIYSGGQVPWGPKFHGVLLPTPPKEQLMDRYWSHVVNCSSCSTAANGLKVLEVVLQVISLASIGIVAIRQSMMSVVGKIFSLSFAVLCFVASKWLSHFIYKTFYFHDYNHALS